MGKGGGGCKEEEKGGGGGCKEEEKGGGESRGSVVESEGEAGRSRIKSNVGTRSAEIWHEDVAITEENDDW